MIESRDLEKEYFRLASEGGYAKATYEFALLSLADGEIDIAGGSLWRAITQVCFALTHERTLTLARTHTRAHRHTLTHSRTQPHAHS